MTELARAFPFVWIHLPAAAPACAASSAYAVAGPSLLLATVGPPLLHWMLSLLTDSRTEL